MEMTNIRGGESHVAQHRRRDKLRAQHPNCYDHDLEQLWLHQVHIPDLEHLRNFKYGTTSCDHQTVFSSEMLNSVTKSSQGLLKLNDSFSHSMIGSYVSPPNSSSNLNVLADNYTNHPNSIFVGGETNDVNCASSLYPRQPNCYGYNQDVAHSSLGESSIILQNCQAQFGEMQHQCNTISSPFDYQNTLQQVVPNGELDIIARYNAKDSSELLHFLPSFGDSNSLSNTPVDQAFRQWNVEGSANKSQDQQGLSLSLSVDFKESDDLSDTRYSKALKYSNYLCSSSKQSSAGSKGFGFEHGLRNIYNVAGPHGPFTGYASILKDSKYLKPTLELLEDLCVSSKQKICEINPDDLDDEEDFSGSSVSESSWPAYHKKMASLLYLQQEVCRKYKQYQQQMQMVVSSFESVEGVSTATPYISMALKTISMHFRCLKDSISDQLKHTGKELGEDLSSPTAGTSSSKFVGDARNFQKQKSCGSNNCISFEPKQPVWKPQRGLPERAVSILRAWLFDHFLHPYPTDTDKHMLAIQTGLTRNQVSNWFINARVRIWKPMVEEIHLLETKGMAEESTHMTTDKGRENMGLGCASHQYDYNQPANRLSGKDAFTNNDGTREVYWNQEKRSRIECHNIPVSIEGSFMSFLPYQQQQQDGFEIGGGHGNVSLTLGLRQNAVSVQQHGQHL